MDSEKRIVILIDMDCFYCQVEEKLNPELKGKPIAVVQYNPWKGGGIIAVNYVARAQGVTRHMRGDEAKEKCPDIALPSVPCQRGKANITKYRDAGKDVARILQRFTPLLERASIDEAYLDITAPVLERLKTCNVNSITTQNVPNTYALGYNNVDEFMTDVRNCCNDSIDFDYDNAKMLLIGAVIVSEIRAAVFEETGYTCSAGIAHNKILAKLVCGMNKPNKQTVLAKHAVNILYKTLNVKKVKHLGGKFGDNVCETLRISKMAELQMFTEKELQAKFDDKNGTWLYNIARGIDIEPVQAKFNPKSIGCCKQFKGKNALLDLHSLKKWLKDLGDEIEDRLEKDSLETNRTAKQMVVSFSTQMPDGRDVSSSRSYNFVADDDLCSELFSNKALDMVMDSVEGVKAIEGEPNRKLQMPIKFLGISVGKFEDNNETKKTRKIVDFFSAGTSKDQTQTNKENINRNETKNTQKVEKKINDKEYILQKFFQTSKPKKSNESNKIEDNETHCNANEKFKEAEVTEDKKSKHNVTLQSSLDKQESFFAKFLNKNQNRNGDQKDINKNDDQKDTNKNSSIKDRTDARVTTPVCNIMECGDSSNDTDYSGSTINNEINTSIALFDDSPEDVARVSNMRELLNSTKLDETHLSENKKSPKENSKPSSPFIEMFQCSECMKEVAMSDFDTHTDYHLALRLRDEERQQVKKARETVQSVKKVEVKSVTKCDNNTSIASFLVKIDETIPTETCAECGKKIAVEKFTEHSDFHEAQKLSRVLNKRPLPNNYSSNSVKRKRKSVSPIKKPKMLCKSIDSFFK